MLLIRDDAFCTVYNMRIHAHFILELLVLQITYKWYVLVYNRQHSRSYQSLLDTMKRSVNDQHCMTTSHISLTNDIGKRSYRHTCASSCASTPITWGNPTFLDIDWHRPVGDYLNHLRIRMYAVFVDDAPEKWKLCSGYLHFGLVLNFHAWLSIHSSAMNEQIVEVTQCAMSHQSW